MKSSQLVFYEDIIQIDVNHETPVLDSPHDDLNRKIVQMLQNDGRLPYRDIAEVLCVSEGTIRNRVQRMREAGMLNFVALVDPLAVKYKADAMLGHQCGIAAYPTAGCGTFV